MSASQIKLLSWTLAGVMGVLLSLYVAWFVSRLDTIYERVGAGEMTAKLEDVGEIVEKADDIVRYEDVELSMINLDWTGRPPAAPAPEIIAPPAPKFDEKKVAELIDITWISFDSDDPEGSAVVLVYRPLAEVRSAPTSQTRTPGWIKRVGDRLDDPIGHIIVADIRNHAVEFSFGDETREHEFVGPPDYPLEGILVLDDASQLKTRPKNVLIPRGASRFEAQPKTREIRRNVYRLGFEDTQYINDNYTEILSQEVRYARHLDPNTGRADGIQIMEVKSGSIAGAHGVQTGDVIKSINGHPVTTPSEAISYVKNHKDEADKWEVVIMSKGQLVTKTYYSPEK